LSHAAVMLEALELELAFTAMVIAAQAIKI